MNPLLLLRCGLLASVLYVVPYSSLFSQQADNGFIAFDAESDTLILESGIIHLGDWTGNQGITFSKEFALTDSQYSRLKYARLYVDFIPDYGPYYENPPRLFVNNTPLGSIKPFFPPIGWGCWQYNADGTHDYCGFMRVALNVSPTILTSGNNTFRIDNGAPDDDYRFTRVMVILFYSGKVNPECNDLWTAGEQDTIRWIGIENGLWLSIEYSTDSGINWQGIVAGVSSSERAYAWHLPKGILSAKCLIRIKNTSTGEVLATSDLFKIKPFTLSRVDPATGNYIAYDYNKDRWGFGNEEEDVWPYLYWYSRFSYNAGMDPFTGQPYPSWETGLPFGSAKDSDFPDWPTFVRAFTVEACYISLPLAVYSQRAAACWESAKDSWGGSCFGIAGTNALAFVKRSSMEERIPPLKIFYDPILVQSSDTVISTVGEIYTHQYGNLSVNNDLIGREKTPTQTLGDLREMLRQEETPLRTLTIGKRTSPDEGYHTILAYWVERAADDSPVWKVHVYDNSCPNLPDPVIEIDTSQNYGSGRWTPTYAWPRWGGGQDIYLEVPCENYLSHPVLPKRAAPASPFEVSPGLLEVAGGRDASMSIRDASGNVSGYANGQVYDDIPGSAPLFVKNGSPGPPYAYMLPSGNYSITMDSVKTPEPKIYFFTRDRTLGYWRSGADSLQRDRLQYDTTGGASLRIVNPDPQTKSIALKTILSEPGLEKIYTISGLALAWNDSAAMGGCGTDGLKLVSHGVAKEYTFRVEHASGGGLRVFSKAHVPLAANTAHMITPDWGVLGGDLTILVDTGNDGTVDDTLTLKNDLTGTSDHGSLIPEEYRLEQNYPNPFNPVTTIRYGLPQKSEVKLTVYNLLGQEVARLLEGEREAGYHEVKFNASGLASGIYIYRLQAGNVILARKLLLLR